jgi:hypothetical protein
MVGARFGERHAYQRSEVLWPRLRLAIFAAACAGCGTGLQQDDGARVAQWSFHHATYPALLMIPAQVFRRFAVTSKSWGALGGLSMSKITKLLAALCVAGAAVAALPDAALAQRHGGGGHGGGGFHGGGGHWRGGGGGWRGGWGPGFGFGFGTPYYYGSPYYYGDSCGYARVRVWRNGHWVLRRAYRCY